MRALALVIRLKIGAVIGLCSCDALFTNNPQNCVVSAQSCGPDAFCNTETRRCETLDCTQNSGLCRAPQICSETTKRCEIRTFVLGQPDALSNRNVAYGLHYPWMSQLVPDAGSGRTRLLVADTNNDRVLIWNDVPAQNRPADVVLGMPDVNTVSIRETYNGVNEGSMMQPWSIVSDGTNLIVGDYGHYRTLIWDRIPTQTGSAEPPPATGLWGQSSFLSSQPNGGAQAVNALGTSPARGFLSHSTRRDFFLVDWLNSRVLVFDMLPTSPTQLPSVVLGQPDFASNTAAVGASGLSGPRAVWEDASGLYLADGDNHRVLKFSAPYVNYQAAIAVFGQANFTANLPNAGSAAPSAATLARPSGLCAMGSGTNHHLYVADHQNHRVLRFVNGAPSADLVLGQPDFVSNQPNRGGAVAADTLNGPTDVSCEATRIAVTDYYNHRVLIWRLPVSGSGAPADIVIGQPGATSGLLNNPPSRSAFQFQGPQNVYSDGVRLFVADNGSHRVLIYNRLPQDGITSPDVVLGQRDFVGERPNTGFAAPSASSLANPVGIATENGRLAIGDCQNHRILLWNQVPAQSFAPADFVIGQPDFTSDMAQPPQTGLEAPIALILHEGTLYVADYGHHRVLIYRDPFRTGAVPDFVLGQPDLTSVVANNGGQKADSLALPTSLLISDGKLLVADAGNHRVLVYSLPITGNFQAADLVIGQLNFESSYTRADRTRLDYPNGLLVHSGRLFVSAASQNRVLFWNQLPTVNGQRADGVLGQTDFLSTLPNNYDVPPIERLSVPTGITTAGDYLFIADQLNNRVVARSLPRP